LIGDFDGVYNTTGASTQTNHSTIAFVAPEIASGAQTKFTAACDIYACGRILSELFDDVLLIVADSTEKRKLVDSLTATKPQDRVTAQTALQNKLLEVVHAVLDINKQCAMCGEVFASSKGLVCGATVGNVSHFICDECVDGYVSAHTSAASAPYLQ
jgi:hypothetical protein